MKKYIFLILFLFGVKSFAQTSSDVSRIVLNAFVIDPEMKMPEEARGQLISKLQQIASTNGLGGGSINPRFVIAVKANVSTKDIVSGPPQMVAMNIEFVFFVGDAIDNNIYSNVSLSAKGLGNNENKAYINAIQNISPKNKAFSALINTGKDKIVEYYSSQCDIILSKANTLAQKQNYEEAIYQLMQVPEVCKLCYDKCMSAVGPIFQKAIDRDGKLKLNEAKGIWNANQNIKGAEQVVGLLSSIEPACSTYKEAVAFSESIKKKIQADEKREWDFKMKKYANSVALEKQRIEASKEIAVAYYQNQPQTIIYSRIIW